jgi:branched-chain amino acid transport system substrate-binding protein
MSRARATRLLAVVIAMALLAGACADDGDDTTTATTTTAPGTPGTGPTTTTAADPLRALGVDLSDCGSSYRPTQGVGANEILIGQSVPKSGPSQAFSLLTTGMRAYFDYANAELGGVNGRSLKLVDLDDGYEPSKTAQNVEQLLSQGVFLMSGILGTPHNLAVRDELNERCVPHLFPSTGAPEWGEVEDYPWTVAGAVIPYNAEARMWAEYLKQQFPNGARVVALQMDNDFGTSYVDWFRRAIEGSNIQLVRVEKHDPLAAGILNQMTTLSASNADVAIAMTTSSYCSQFMKALENNSWKPVKLISGTCVSSIFFAAGGGGAVGALIAAATKEIADPAFDDDPGVRKIREGLATYAPAAPISVSLVPIGWVFGEVLRDVLLRAEAKPGGLTRPNVLLAARETDFSSPLLLDGVKMKLDGLKDPYLVEAARFQRWTGTRFEQATELFQYEGTVRPKP